MVLHPDDGNNPRNGSMWPALEGFVTLAANRFR
jgi:hypothetical protein